MQITFNREYRTTNEIQESTGQQQKYRNLQDLQDRWDHCCLLQDWLHGFPGLFTDTSEHVHFVLFTLSIFPLFGCWFWFCVERSKTNLDFTEARDSEWQWHQLGQVCTSLQTDNHTSTHHSVFYRLDALPAAQPTASKHWRQHNPAIIAAHIFQYWKHTTICNNVTMMPKSYIHCSYSCRHQCLVWRYKAFVADWPKFFIRLNVSLGEEAHPREPHILVVDKHLDWDQVRLTQMIYETTHVAIARRVDTEGVRLLNMRTHTHAHTHTHANTHTHTHTPV